LGQYSLDGIHCGQLIVRKISKTDATRCQNDFKAKCTKFDFRIPDPDEGAYNALRFPDP